MKIKVILLMLILSYITQGAEQKFDGIIISGNTKFNKQILSALKLLKEDSPINYQYVKIYVGKIEQSAKSGMRAYANPPTYDISDETAYHSLSWCASTIAHDAYHSYLYHKFKKIHGVRVPYNLWGGTEAELKAIEIQIATMLDINAPKYQIDYLRGSDGTHGDVNKDGKLTQEDYQLRSW